MEVQDKKTQEMKTEEVKTNEVGKKETSVMDKVKNVLQEAKGEKEDLTREEADAIVKEKFGDEQPEMPDDLNKNKGNEVSFGGMGPCERKCAKEEHVTGYRY